MLKRKLQNWPVSFQTTIDCLISLQLCQRIGMLEWNAFTLDRMNSCRDAPTLMGEPRANSFKPRIRYNLAPQSLTRYARGDMRLAQTITGPAQPHQTGNWGAHLRGGRNQW